MEIDDLTYENVRKNGGFAIIKRYVHKDSRKKFAIKQLLPEFHSQPDYIERFIKEIEYTKRLQDNENIIKIVGVQIDHTTKTYYYIMPYAKMNLDEYISLNNSYLDFNERVSLFEQVLNAISYAHKNNIWHRDLTPTNILIFDEDTDIRLKVCDFGLGKDPESLSRMANSSIGGHGQWMYVDPDQYESLKKGTNLSDILSLGKILYFIMTGKKPLIIKDCKFKSVIDKAVNKEFSDISGFEEEYIKLRDIYLTLEETSSLTLLEYVDKQKKDIEWNEFYKLSLKGESTEHIYYDFMEPAMRILSDENSTFTFLEVVGTDDELFINKFIEALHYCHHNYGWPFNKQNNFTRFLIRYSHCSTSQKVKLECLKEAWYIAAVNDQWDSQEVILDVFSRYEIADSIVDELCIYILENGQPFEKLNRINLNRIRSPKIKRALAKLREKL
ncbi:protein kinase domain-containing protein [Bacillus salipaludis]|uniref:protein kinase domain-containing protein n=1 Tax=Bacillus salipaludis TaxID=2547811 RepID=UPI002E21F308|nr:protein kinase [Bacillus salipaludis]